MKAIYYFVNKILKKEEAPVPVIFNTKKKIRRIMFCKEVMFYLYKADSNADLKKIVREGNSSIGARPCLFLI